MDLRRAYMGIILMGLVSLFGDIVYEGARGQIPDFLNFLGASALIVGIVTGAGEFIGYAIRLVSGYLADNTKAYWLFVFLGYGFVGFIPLLAIATGWQLAAIFVLMERLGKALRSPSRDTILSLISEGVGSGRAFGLHETLDQIGAIIGPLVVGSLMLFLNNYSFSFGILALPFIIMVALLFYLYHSTKGIVESRVKREEDGEKKERKLTKSFWLYTLAVTANTIGLIHISLILFRGSQIFQPLGMAGMTSMLFVTVQGIDAAIAYVVGIAYDRIGTRFLYLPFIISLFPAALALYTNDVTVLFIASALFGVVLGMQETIYRAVIADMVDLNSRGFAYGIFNAVYGFAFLISGAIFGFFIDRAVSVHVVIIYTLIFQLSACVLLHYSQKEKAF
jgi:MFS family permease